MHKVPVSQMLMSLDPELGVFSQQASRAIYYLTFNEGWKLKQVQLCVPSKSEEKRGYAY